MSVTVAILIVMTAFRYSQVLLFIKLIRGLKMNVQTGRIYSTNIHIPSAH